MTMICLECGLEFERLTLHIFEHGLTLEAYVIKHMHGGVRPTCACGCGSLVTFYRGAFKRFVRGHASRDPIICKQMIEGGQAAAADPEKRKKNSDGVTRKWQEDEYRAKIHAPAAQANRTKAIRISHNKPEFCEKMSNIKHELWQNEEWAKQQRERTQSEEFSAKVSEATELALAKPECKQKMSDKARLAFREGRRKPRSNWSNVNAGFRPDPATGIDVWYDSGWEYEFACVCFDADVECVREPCGIPYVDAAGVERTYFPDFVVKGKIIVEVKGQETSGDAAKYAAGEDWANQHGMSYVVLRKPKKFKEYVLSIMNA